VLEDLSAVLTREALAMSFIDSFYHLYVTTFHTLHMVEAWTAYRYNVTLMALSTGGAEFRLASGAASYDSPISSVSFQVR
jgi:hypothetical protein